MKENTKEILKLIVITLIMLAVIIYFKDVLGLVGNFVGLLSPLILGLIMAFVLNVPMKAIERGISHLDKKKKCKQGIKRSLAILGSFVIIVVVLVLVGILIVPNIISTTISLGALVQNQLPQFLDQIQQEYKIDLSQLEAFIDSLQIGNLLNGALGMVSGMSAAVSTTVSSLINIVMGIIIAVYVLAGKEKLASQMDRLLRAFLKERIYKSVIHVGKLINDTYSSFLTGQCLEAVIISILMTVVLSICRIPYAAMIGILAGVLSFIPYVGSFVACFAGAFFILIMNPWMALAEIVIFQIVQFIEGQFIYPRVVGSSVGLPPLFTLMAALLGGSLFGLVGMIFFIPIVAVIYTLLAEITNSRLKKA